MEGYGDVKVGMTPQEASAALTRPLLPLNAGEEDEPCYYLFPDGDPDKPIAFMVSEGRIARVDVDQPRVTTAEGGEVGDSEQAVIDLHSARLVVSPHKYGGPNDHYLTARSPDGASALVYETRDGTITSFHAGKLPEAEYIEGCS
jgi:hypothetical protein